VSGLVVLAIDPGARGTGIVVRQRDQLVGSRLVERTGPEVLPGATYLHQVNAVISQLLVHAPGVLAVENLHAPNPHLGMTNVGGALGAAMVLGAILDRWGVDVLLVPPGGHGSGPLGAYPAALRGPRERKGTGARRHLRSAWDVAGAAVVMVRMGQQGRPT
jgi:hypothetical protein